MSDVLSHFDQDLVFLFYYVVVFSFIRQMLTIHVFQRFARWCGIRSSGKVERFGEQGYALVYFGTMGAWGTVKCADIRFFTQLRMIADDHEGFADMVVSNGIFLDWYF
jgi:hypothetical protein